MKCVYFTILSPRLRIAVLYSISWSDILFLFYRLDLESNMSATACVVQCDWHSVLINYHGIIRRGSDGNSLGMGIGGIRLHFTAYEYHVRRRGVVKR